MHVREHRHVVSKAAVIATGLRRDGRREVLGVDIDDSEDESFWTGSSASSKIADWPRVI